MDDAVAGAVVWVVAHVVVKSRCLDFRRLIFIVPVCHIVVFEAMKMWVMGCHLGEIGVGRAPERLWKNDTKGNAASGGHAFSLVYRGWRKGWCRRAREERDARRQCTSGTAGREAVKG